MIHIAICDDDIEICRELKRRISDWREKRDTEIDVFKTGKEFEEELRETYYDIIFLDIVLEDVVGIELGRILREDLKNETSLIIYMSQYSEHAIELFKFQPFGFLQKPIETSELQKVFYQACDRVERNSGIFEFKSGRAICRLPFDKIHYFEGDNRRVKIVTDANIYYCYSTIEKLFSKINMEQVGFVRIHKSYALNTNYISTFTTKLVKTFDGKAFTVSAQFKENAQRQYEAYLERMG